MACLRASFASFKVLRSSASVLRFVAGSVFSGALQAGQRLAKPGLPGLSSNSSEQTTQIRMGNATQLPALQGIVDSAFSVPNNRTPCAIRL